MNDNLCLLNDHTSIHSLGRALEGNGHGEIDLKALLQLACEIVFAEKIFLNGYEKPFVHHRTEKILEKLKIQGVTENEITILDKRNTLYILCEKAAKKFAINLENADLHPKGIMDFPEGRPELSEDQKEFEFHIHETIMQERYESLNDPQSMAEATICMFTEETLWNKILSLKKENWTEKHTAELIMLSRIFLNDEIAESSNSRYIPAVARAQRIRRYRDQIYKIVNQILLQTNSSRKFRLNEGNIGFPRVTNALVRLSEGHPAAVIETALKLREKAFPLREWLSKKIKKLEHLKPLDNELESLNNEIMELGATLRQTIGEERSPKFLDAIELGVVFPGLPKMLIKPQELKEWWNFRKNKKTVVVLTNVSNHNWYYEHENLKYYNELIKSSCCNTKILI